MADGSDATSSVRRRVPWIWIGIVVAAAAIVIVVGLLAAAGATQEPSAGSTATPSGSATSSSPASSPAATPDATDDTGEVAPPDGVTIDEFGREHLDPVPLDAAPAPKEGLTVTVDDIEAVDGVFTVPGEVAGPALRVTLTVHNDTGKAQPLDLFVVNLYYGPDSTPAETLTQPGGDPLVGAIAAGKAATGVYLFRTPVDKRKQIQIEVDLENTARVVVFEGSAS